MWLRGPGFHFTRGSGQRSFTPRYQVRDSGPSPVGGGGLPDGRAPTSYLQAGYIRATQGLSILATLWGLMSVIFLIMSCIPSLSIRGYGPLVSSTMAFAAGRLRAALGLWGPVGSRRGPEPSLLSSSPAISAVVAMVVYTSERWNQPQHPQIQTFFSWSFYLGWVSAVLLLCTGY